MSYLEDVQSAQTVSSRGLVDHNLRIVDLAIAEVREAWAADPLNPHLMFFSTSMEGNNIAREITAAMTRFVNENVARAIQQGNIDADKLIEECRRAMRVAQMREVDRLEQSLATLATIGSTSPYVGLFGTVWGIMGAFMGLSNAQVATLAVVAPPIAEALIATAMGLFAAIPAVIAYNRYADKVVRLEYRYDGFTEEFSSILQRHARAKHGG